MKIDEDKENVNKRILVRDRMKFLNSKFKIQIS